MEKSEELLEKLKVAVNGGREFWEQSGTLRLEYLLEYLTDHVYTALEDVLKYLIEERHKVEESESKFVIHYTSIGALVSMLKDASQKEQEDEKSYLRLYDSVHLNDPDEGNYFTRNLNLPQKYDWLKEKEVSHAYIASFIYLEKKSKKDINDNLIFWRTYGQEGEGCSLSLSVPHSRLQKILYGTEKVKHTVKYLRSALDVLEPLIKINNSSIRERIQENLARIVRKYLERIRYLYKNEAYEYENECRFVVTESNISDKNKIRFDDQEQNNSPGHIRHYYEHEDLKIDTLLVTGSLITLGPCVPYPYNVEYYLKTLMERARLGGQEIKISKIPYRKS